MPTEPQITIDQIDRIAPTRRPPGQAVMRQSWRDLLFLHWPVPAETIAPYLPPGLTVDTFDGQAYIGVIPFTMRAVRPAGFPPLPYLSYFHECNVRTYVHHNGVPGVWFFSLDAANPIAVWLARCFFHLPYFYARMVMAHEGETIRYVTWRRRFNSQAYMSASILKDSARMGQIEGFFGVRYRPTGVSAPAAIGTLEHFLAERYLLYAHDGRRLYRGQVHHRPYQLQSAQIERLENHLAAANGLTLAQPHNPPLVHYVRGVDVEIFLLHLV